MKTIVKSISIILLTLITSQPIHADTIENKLPVYFQIKLDPMNKPNIELELEDNHLVPEIDYYKATSFFLVPKQFSFKIPYASNGLKINSEITERELILGIADFTSNKGNWRLIAELNNNLGLKKYELAWKQTPIEFIDYENISLNPSKYTNSNNIKVTDVVLRPEASVNIAQANAQEIMQGYYGILLSDIKLHTFEYNKESIIEPIDVGITWKLETLLKVGEGS